MSESDWSVDPINETLPAFAAPDDPAIVIGSDLPPCMRARYSSAIFFRPPNTVTNTINRPIKFIGQVINPVSGQVDEGWALWDQNDPATICGFYVYKTTTAPLIIAGSGNSLPQEFYNQIAQSGSAGMPAGGSTNFGSTFFGVGTGWAVNIGDGTATPANAGFSIDGVSARRSIRTRVDSTGNTGAIGAESVVLTGGSFTAYQNRGYEIVLVYAQSCSVANAMGGMIRLTNLAGPVLCQFGDSNPIVGVGPSFTHVMRVVKTSATSTVNFVQTALSSAGTITQLGSATQPRFMEVWDCGANGSFGFSPTF